MFQDLTPYLELWAKAMEEYLDPTEWVIGGENPHSNGEDTFLCIPVQYDNALPHGCVVLLAGDTIAGVFYND